MDIIKNPVVVGVICGIITYVYMKYTSDKINERRIKRMKKENVKLKLDKVNLLIPLALSIVGWFFATNYFESEEKAEQIVVVSDMPTMLDTGKIPQTGGIGELNKQMNNVIESLSDSARSYHLISRGLNIPNNIKMPDVFIETI